MKIKEIYIKDFKNLKDFTITFNSNPCIDFLIGKNGSGKSNLLEAIIEIFLFLLKEKDECFDFNIEYLINDYNMKVSYFSSEKKLKLNGEVISEIEINKLPKMILTYYSGHNKRVPKYIEKSINYYTGENNKSLLTSKKKEIRTLIGFKEEDKKVLLLILTLLEDTYFSEKLNINTNNFKGKLVLKDYRKTPLKLESMHEGEKNYLWGLKGEIKENLVDIIQGNKGNTIDGTEGFLVEDQEYYITLNKEVLSNFIELKGTKILFKLFNDLTLLGMVKSLSVKVEKNNEIEIKLDELSDGESQLFLLRSLTKIFEGEENLILLDEPDAFLHPEWQADLFENLDDIYLEKNHIITTSHNVSSLIKIKDKIRVNLFGDKEGKTKSHLAGKEHGINKLSSGYTILKRNQPFISVLQNIDKPVLFTEGTSDTIIIETAWSKLRTTEMPFIPIAAFSAEYVKRLLRDEGIHNEIGDKSLFGLFDFDQAYDQWNGIRIKGDLIEKDPFKGLCSKLKDKKVYAYLLPVPHKEEVKKLVISNEEGETFKQESRHSIELMFYGKFEGYESHFESKSCIGGKRVVFKGNKVKFANETVKKLERDSFLDFEPLFSSIEEKI